MLNLVLPLCRSVSFWLVLLVRLLLHVFFLLVCVVLSCVCSGNLLVLVWNFPVVSFLLVQWGLSAVLCIGFPVLVLLFPFVVKFLLVVSVCLVVGLWVLVLLLVLSSLFFVVGRLVWVRGRSFPCVGFVSVRYPLSLFCHFVGRRFHVFYPLCFWLFCQFCLVFFVCSNWSGAQHFSFVWFV